MIMALICLTANMVSQNYRYYKPGQNFSSNENACLVIKNDKRTLIFIDQLNKYSSFKAIKLIGFNEPGFDMDSLITMIDEDLDPKTIIFENCDLSGLTESLELFKELEEVHLLSNCIFYENNLFELLKNCPVKRICIQKKDVDLATDSLHLLKDLVSLKVSSNNSFTLPNKIEKIQIEVNENVHTVDLAYFGNFYKENKNKSVLVNYPVTIKHAIKSVPMACIKQPIPGIDINDTVYNFNAMAGGTIFYESGSEITIDKNAFVTLSGQNYTGNVKLFYREFRNPVEIMLSGIPMSTKVGEKMELFKSGGMYEISAFDVNGDELKTKSDTSIKINFALTDTSENFKFYSLNNDGSWTTTDVKIEPKKSNIEVDSSVFATKAVKEYFGFFNTGGPKSYADTTLYEERFLSNDYLYTYRKDNLEVGKDSVLFHSFYGGVFRSKKTKANFRVKYLRQTKYKEIVFTIVPAKKDKYYDIPKYILALLDKAFVYTGSLTKEEFKRIYHRKLLCWDLRVNSTGNGLAVNIKTDKTHLSLTCNLINLKDNGTYYIPKKANLLLCNSIQKTINKEAKDFNKKGRFNYTYFNDSYKNNFKNFNWHEQAFVHSKKFQNESEAKLDLKAWKKYVKNKYPNYYSNSFQNNNKVGNALVKSDLGVKNIDAYLHAGQMEDILVNYNNNVKGNFTDEYNAVLFKNINTSYALTKNNVDDGSLAGYYFKKRANYIIRFSQNGYMQVTKPNDVKDLKRGNKISIAYQEQYNVKDMTSKDITRLILD